MVPSLIQQFLLVHRFRSLGRAATALGLSQPALSKAVRRLEAELGAPLFERRPAGVVPTAIGSALAARFTVIAAEFERAKLEVEELRAARGGLLRLGVAPALAPVQLPRAIAALLGSEPTVRIAVREGLYPALAEGVVSGALDLALCNRPWERLPGGLVAASLFRDEFVVASGVRHPLRRRSDVPAEALTAWPWALPPRDGPLWPRIVDLFVRAGQTPPHPAVETDSFNLLRGLLEGGSFLSFLPRRLLGTGLHAVDAPGFSIPREIVALGREDATASALAGRFLRLLAEGDDRRA